MVAMMKNINGFFREKIDSILLFVMILLVFWIVFYLNRLDMSIYILAVQLSVFVYCIYLFIVFFKYNNTKRIEAIVEALKSENRSLKYEYNVSRREMREYFMMWIHQIKTPITATKLILDSDKIDNRELLKQLFYIDDYTNMALNYLKISEFERDMDICGVPIDSIIKSILRKYSILFISNKISLEYEPIDFMITTDAKWFGILVEQIVSNAVKYTRNGKAGLKLQHDDEGFVLEIYDTGIGISREDLPKIFDSGYSGFNGRTNQKSSGIGLFLAKQIADKLELAIEVESAVGKGSSFFIKGKSKRQ
ncbi:sensor histidine kinase [Peptostreptococcus sp. D1]|uniref:sensor histidine kinase n=1 Tax=Peptostreptococcus sp. D1 TaxID=72304 RepID=UPI0008F3B332|nr:sensor histidine kinase [Peptostreptococcus sp. D1]SFE55200.1 two-component system, OmpR family, sensor histidine kinase BraS/BceS [Peptostreptococcus sp. D1]